MNDKKIGILDKDGKNINPLNNQEYSDNYKNLSKFWSSLPAYDFSKNVITSIKKNDVILIASGTGSGKTVLIPKFALHANDYKGKIIVTLPKKIITKKAAEYAALTLDVPLGEQVGYQFRGDNLKTDETILLYSTDGSIISMIKSDPLMSEIDIIIIDEAHERKIQIDLLLYLLKNAINKRKEMNIKPLKLIIMSATINEKIFASYYKNFKFDYMFLSGKPNYPITSTYLDKPLAKKSDYLLKGVEVIKDIIKNINNKKSPEGDILFFVCSINECKTLTMDLSSELKDSFIMALYGNFPSELEKYITEPYRYKELNKNYKRRIFISTNVAESSLTIDGIVYVIDTGLEINVKYDPKKKINVMSKDIITKAQVSQRKGRAGRTKEGFCYHLYTIENFEKHKNFLILKFAV